MRNLGFVFVGLSLAAGVACAQGNDPDKVTATGGVMVTGWQGRIDPQAAKGGRNISQDKVVSMGSGFHVTSGPAAIYWNPANTASGNYTVTGSFTQTKAPTHPEAYGLFVGGSNLAGATQKYTYFLVRQDGQYMISRRDGAKVNAVVPWTDSPAVKQTNASAKGTNLLSIVVAPDKTRFLVNGTEVHSQPTASVDASGIAGLRINHNLNVHVDGFGVK